MLQELRFTGSELRFRVTIQFITLREERIVEEIIWKEKNAKLKIVNLLQIRSSVFFSLGNPEERFGEYI